MFSMQVMNMFKKTEPEKAVMFIDEVKKCDTKTILYFWHMKCPHCPAKLSLLNNICKLKKIKVMAIHIEVDVNEDNPMSFVFNVIDEMDLKNVEHYYMDQMQKTFAKEVFNFSTVPHMLSYDKSVDKFNVITVEECKLL